MGQNESIQDIAELYLGKRMRWNEIAACNPDIDPLLITAGTNVYIPIIPNKPSVRQTKEAKPPRVSKPAPVREETRTSNVAIRGEEPPPPSMGDVPIMKTASAPPAREAAKEVRTHDPAFGTEEGEKFTVLPNPGLPLEPPRAAAVPAPTSSENATEDSVPLASPTQQTASTLLTCTGKECLPR